MSGFLKCLDLDVFMVVEMVIGVGQWTVWGRVCAFVARQTDK